uniref:S1 motif domain-containing protein n=1 Tax=Angiostrongylus cantonensis TaxID=6313 RepID=A0A0K0D3W9_ANGCA
MRISREGELFKVGIVPMHYVRVVLQTQNIGFSIRLASMSNPWLDGSQPLRADMGLNPALAGEKMIV